MPSGRNNLDFLDIVVYEAGIAAIDVDHQWAAYTLRRKRGIFSVTFSVVGSEMMVQEIGMGTKRESELPVMPGIPIE